MKKQKLFYFFGTHPFIFLYILFLACNPRYTTKPTPFVTAERSQSPPTNSQNPGDPHSANKPPASTKENTLQTREKSSTLWEKPISKVILVQGVETEPEGQSILLVYLDGKAEFSQTLIKKNQEANKTLPKTRKLRLYLDSTMKENLFSCLEENIYFDPKTEAAVLTKQYENFWQGKKIFGLFIAAEQGSQARRTLLTKSKEQAKQMHACFQESWEWMRKQFSLLPKTE